MSESTIETLFFVYFVVFAAVVIGHWLYFRKKDPVFRWRWHARTILLVGFIIGGYLVVLAGLTSRSWAMAGGALVFAVAILFLNITLTTICHSCGKAAQSQSLTSAAKYCIHCGGPVAPSPLFAPAGAMPPGIQKNPHPGIEEVT